MSKRLINVPAKATMVIIREEFLAVTQGDACAAAILNWAERWAMWLGSTGQGQWIKGKNKADISKALMGMFKRHEIEQALALLRDCGFIRMARDPRNAWDRKYMYVFDTERVQEAIDAYFSAIDDLQVDHRSATGGSSIPDGQRIDDLQVDHRFSTGGVSTLEKQNLLTDSKKQNADQKAAADHARERAAAAAADSITDEMRESSDQQMHPNPIAKGIGNHQETQIFNVGTLGEANTTPPNFGGPPLRTAVSVYVANMGKAGDVVQRGIAAAVARHGEAVVVSTIERAAAKGGRTWAYVETMLADVRSDVKWNTGADATDQPNDDLAGWDGTGSPWDFIRAKFGIVEGQP